MNRSTHRSAAGFCRVGRRSVEAVLLIFALVGGLLVAGCTGPGGSPGASYHVENVPTPDSLTAETGGFDFTPDGRLVAAFHRGEVMTYRPESGEWSIFARGLHDPLGVKAFSDSSVLVMQRPELTRLEDTDGDGEADWYRTVTDDFGLSGNYHEFNYGPLIDSTGRMYLGLNTASNGAGIFDITRGEVREEGLEGRMYAAVPYRGWMMKYFPERDTLMPFAAGFRSPNGFNFDGEGRLLVTDNQGDWLGTNKLFVVEKDAFHGHPAALVWKEGFEGIQPLDLPVPVLEEMRRKAAVLLPHGILSNSATQPVRVSGERGFGPFEGQLLIGEMNFPRVLRVWLEEVHGVVQGAATTLIDSTGPHQTGTRLEIGNNRLTWGPDGALWLGQTDHGWTGRPGIQKVSYTGTVPFAVKSMRLTPDGFRLRFTLPVDPATVRTDTAFAFSRYRYRYNQEYGSPRIDQAEVPITGQTVSDDGRTVQLELGDLREDFVYQLDLRGVTAERGDPLSHEQIFYTIRRLRQ